jgi:hypothetical protein
MNISAEEKLMYEVMKAIYESGISVSFNGANNKIFSKSNGQSQD